MIIIGVDYHPSFQQIAFMDQKTGECGERQLNHSDGEAERFYRELKERGVSVLTGRAGFRVVDWIRRRLRPSESGSRKPTARMLDSC